jgi:hypothetical protein
MRSRAGRRIFGRVAYEPKKLGNVLAGSGLQPYARPVVSPRERAALCQACQ